MRPIWIGILGVLAFVPASWAQDQPPGAPSAKAGSVRARLEAIGREYTEAQRAPFAAYRKATTDDERKKAVASRPDAKKYVARVMELAESAPDDPAAVDALLWVVNRGGQTREADRAIELLARDHAQDPKIMRIGSTPANSSSPAGERLLRAIAEKSPDRAVQKRAAFALARLLSNEAELIRRMKQNNNGFAASVTIFQGPECAEALLAKDPDALAKQGESLFRAAVEKFGAASDIEGDLAKAALAELREIRGLAIGKTAPEITGEDLNGRPMKLSDYRGKVVVLVFCGDWCGPCRAMYPHERSLVKRLEGKPFALVGINSDRDPQKLNERIKKENITWPSWRDGGSTQGPIATAWNVNAWPTIYVLDHKGVIRYTGVRDKAMDKAVNTLLREMGIDVEIDATSEPR